MKTQRIALGATSSIRLWEDEAAPARVELRQGGGGDGRTDLIVIPAEHVQRVIAALARTMAARQARRKEREP